MPNDADIRLIGHVGREPESDTTAKGTQRCRFSLAVNVYIAGETVANWYNVTVFGQSAEFVQNYITTGQPVLVKGDLVLREYQGRDGATKISPDVTAYKVISLSGRDDEGGGGEYRKTSRTTNAATNAGPPKSASKSAGKGATRTTPSKPRDDDDSSLPF
jgi:single-strand DNA-binding protein